MSFILLGFIVKNILYSPDYPINLSIYEIFESVLKIELPDN
jgi:hypothetical protein